MFPKTLQKQEKNHPAATSQLPDKLALIDFLRTPKTIKKMLSFMGLKDIGNLSLPFGQTGHKYPFCTTNGLNSLMSGCDSLCFC